LVADIKRTDELLLAEGFEYDGYNHGKDDQSHWRSMRHKETNVNILATQCPEWHKRFALATRIATELGLTIRKQRVQLFQAILYGNG